VRRQRHLKILKSKQSCGLSWCRAHTLRHQEPRTAQDNEDDQGMSSRTLQLVHLSGVSFWIIPKNLVTPAHRAVMGYRC
jgi:hypothetical protein